MEKTPREIREDLIIEWYRKKLNRDELLRVLEWSGLDKDIKEKYRSEIIQNFYEKFEEAKDNEKFKSADVKYKTIKKLWRNFEKRSSEIIEKEGESEKLLKDIDREILGIAAMAMDLEDESWWKRWKLGKAKKELDELEAQQKKIRLEIWQLKKEKDKLDASLKAEWEAYWPKLTRTINEFKKNEEIFVPVGVIEDITLKWYKEKYYQVIEDKKNYMKNVLSEIKSLDLWIDEEKKKNILEEVEANLKQEIEIMEWWNETIEFANTAEKWLKENWKKVMENLSVLQQEIWEIKEKMGELDNKKEWLNAGEVYEVITKQYELGLELSRKQDEFDTLKKELSEKVERYDGTHLNWSEELRVESWEEKCDRERKNNLSIWN